MPGRSLPDSRRIGFSLEVGENGEASLEKS